MTALTIETTSTTPHAEMTLVLGNDASFFYVLYSKN